MEHSQREIDGNGFITIERNPISKSGVFQYSGRSLPGADPDKIYNVYRPDSELNNPETLNSFKLIPLVNDHTMLGAGYATSAEEKGVHGSTGENVVFENGILYATLRIFSTTLKHLIDNAKKDISAGYKCMYEKSSGFFNGTSYDYIQRNIRGNHLALVHEGRCGSEVSVLDTMAFDHFDLALDKGEEKMADEKKEEKKEATAKDKEEGGAAEGGAKAHTLEEALALLKTLVPQVKALAEALAGKADKEEGTATLDKEEEEKKKAMDADKEEKKEKEGMDAIEKRLAKVEGRTEKEIWAAASARDKLAREVSAVVGTFDSSEMNVQEVAAYAVKKLEIKAPEGQEQAALAGFLAGRKASTVGFAQDASLKKEGKLAKRLNA